MVLFWAIRSCRHICWTINDLAMVEIYEIAKSFPTGREIFRKWGRFIVCSISDNQLNQIEQKHMDFSYTDLRRRESEARRNLPIQPRPTVEGYKPQKLVTPGNEYSSVFEQVNGQGLSLKDFKQRPSWRQEEPLSYQTLSSQLKQGHLANLPKRNHSNISSIRDILNPGSSGGALPSTDSSSSFWQLPKLRIPPEETPGRSPYPLGKFCSLKGAPSGHCTTRDYADPLCKPSEILTGRHDGNPFGQPKKEQDKQATFAADRPSPKQALKQTVSTHSTATHFRADNKPTAFKSVRRSVNSLSLADFEVIRHIGQGKFSNVMMVRHRRTGFLYAMKTIQKDRIEKEKLMPQVLREIKISSFVCHPNIITMYGYFDDEENLYLLEELAGDGQLYRLLKKKEKFSEEATAFIIKQVLEAVGHLHKNKIFHRDIKPENIVISHGNIKLCDLGWSVYAGNNELRQTMCGTPLYASPELLQGQKYTEKIDLWAIGILAYELYFGNIPFDINVQEELVRIITDDVVFPEDSEASPEFKDFIQSILKKNPSERLNCQELLRHPFIQKYKDFETCEELCTL